MARLAAQEKGEYYPTPLAVAETIANALHVQPAKNKPVVRLYDPCAGEGHALARIAEILRRRTEREVQTWGVEINPRRAAEAARRLDVVIESPFEATAVKPGRWGVLSLLFLNPPYDFSDDAGYRRMETFFLEKATPALEPGGLLAYLVPPAALDWQNVHLLSQWYEGLSIYRFPDEGDLFEQFHQVVIFGKRLSTRDRRRQPEGLLSELSGRRWGGGVVDAIRERVPPLTDLEPLTIPTTRTKAELLRASWTTDEIEARVEGDVTGGVGRRLQELYGPREALDLEPLVPPKRGHIAQILASGLMGTMAFPGEIMKGRAVKERELVEETVEHDDKGQLTTRRYKDNYTTHIVRVTSDGLEHLSDPQEVTGFLQDNADRLAGVLESRLHPYGDGATPEEEAILARLSPDRYLPGRTETGLLPDQRDTVIAATRSLRRHGIAHIVAEMGYGKTSCGLAIAELTNAYPALVVCPPHLVDKWKREAEEVTPGARPVIVESIGELQAVRRDHAPGDRLIVIVSRSRIKLGPGWKAACPTVRTIPPQDHEQARRRFAEAVERYEEARNALRALRRLGSSDEAMQQQRLVAARAREQALALAEPIHVCPDCGQPVVDGRAIKSEDDLAKRPHKCPNKVLVWDEEEEDYVEVRCGRHTPHQKKGGTPLWQSDNDGHRRWPLADYVAKKMPGFFRLFVVDESHQFKAKNSDQGWAFGLLAGCIPWTLTLTGTFFGGPSTSIFWLLHRTQAGVRQMFPFHGERRWVTEYGVEEVTVKERKGDGGVSHDRGRNRSSVTVREKPGISPAIVRHILPTTVFRSLSDLGMALPPFHDEVVYLEMSEEQALDYKRVYRVAWNALLRFWPRYTSSWLQWVLARPNSCFREETISFPDGESVAVEPVVGKGELLPKEEWLCATVKAELARGRRCLVYLRQTGTRDIRTRLVQVLGQAGVRSQILRETIPPRKREAWLKKHKPAVLITNPKLVETGLDLVQYSTAIFYEPDYSLYTLWQACRRVWRLGQTRPVKVFYAVYVDAMEDLAIRLLGNKLAAAQLLYGDDVAGAIVPAMDDNLVVQLLNAIKAGEAEGLAKAESLFGSDDQSTASPVGNPTRLSPPLISWEKWLLANHGMTFEDIRPRRQRRQVTVPSAQLALGI